MDRSDPIRFLNVCINNSSLFLISGYDCNLYNILTDNNFKKIQFEVNTVTPNFKPKTKIETLWKNYDLENDLDSTQLSLF